LKSKSAVVLCLTAAAALVCATATAQNYPSQCLDWTIAFGPGGGNDIMSRNLIGISLPRGLVLPPGVPKDAQDWWIATMKKVVRTPEWKAYIDKQLLTENVLYGEDFRAFLTRTQGVFADILQKSGAIKKK
jgi:tripartite-type tricarboxylate transporter receptor subunit TctC